MTAETDLLPLPDVKCWRAMKDRNGNVGYSDKPDPKYSESAGTDGLTWVRLDDHKAALQAYARANVEVHTEALRAEVERLKSMTAVTMGVGSGDGNLFVHGDCESIKAAQAIVLERGALRAEVERDKALLRQALEALESGAWDTLRGRNAAAAIRARLGEGEQQ